VLYTVRVLPSMTFLMVVVLPNVAAPSKLILTSDFLATDPN